MKALLANWKTTLAGAMSAGVGLAGLFGVSVSGTTPLSTEGAIGLIITGVGLILGKDFNVSGGNK